MGQCYITRRGTKTGGTTEQLGVYPTGNDGRPAGNVTVLDNVTSLSSHLFQNNANVLTVLLPENLRSMNTYSFQNCTGLQTLSISDKVTKISDYCFDGCSALSKIDLPKNLTEIGNYAFRNCSRLSIINIPENIESLVIKNYAFSECNFLDNETITNLATKPMMSVYNYAFSKLSGITEVTTNYTADYYFSDCPNLRKLTILKTLSNGGFGSYIVNNCTSLKEVVLPDNATIINQNMFYSLPSLRNVNIPKSCVTIGNQAFYNCTGLSELYIWDKITTIQSNSFQGCTNLKRIYIDKLRGSIAEPANRWGAVNATVYYNNPKIKIIRQLPDISVYIDGQNIEDEYEVPQLTDIVCTAYHKDYLPSTVTISAAETNHTYECKPVMSNQDGYRLTLNVTNDYPKIKINYDEVHTFTENSILVPKNSEAAYTIEAYRCEPMSGTVTVIEDTVLNISLNPCFYEKIILQYPFKDYTPSGVDYLSKLNQFEISGKYISNKSTNHNGASYGYITFRTPTAENYSEEIKLKISCYVSSENNCDWGAIWVGKGIWQPALSDIKNNTSHSNGQWLFRSSGTSITAPQEYMMTLEADTEYYINLAYAKDGSSISGSDKLFISRIEFITSV